MLGQDVREAFVSRELVGVVAGQAMEEAPVWRFQELIQAAHQILNGEGR